MKVNNHGPAMVPFEFRNEIESLSKAALMDMVWDFAFQIAEERPDAAMLEFRRRWEIVSNYRKAPRA